jgi:cytoskeletal protein RodZ
MKFFEKEKKIEIDFEQERRAKLAEIGLCLQEFREHQNLSIEVISSQIHIPIRLIEAMEIGNTKELPEPIYTRELLRKYANYLGLKGDDFASHYNIQIQKNNRQNQKLNFSFDLSGLKLNSFSLYIIYIILLFVSVKSLASFLETSPFANNDIHQIETNQLNVSSHTSTKNEPSPPVLPVVENKEQLPPKPKQLMVDITVQHECWVRVTIDGKTEFEGVLSKGDRRKWTAKEKLTIRAGNAGGLLVGFNEQKAKTLGKLGQVGEITFELPSNS